VGGVVGLFAKEEKREMTREKEKGWEEMGQEKGQKGHGLP
jgi:hypothetical protein